ncbi:hypothetical protein SGLAM104S_02955 [Streptomyces glaucescens]
MTYTVYSPAGWTASSRAACATAVPIASRRMSWASVNAPPDEPVRPLSIHSPRSSGSLTSRGIRNWGHSDRCRSPRRRAIGSSIGTR